MKHIILTFALLTTISIGFSQNNLKLWYQQPANNWNEALPVGNGRLAAMIFGNPEVEQLQLNEETVWSGSPYNNVNPDVKPVVQELRKLILEKKFAEAQRLANKKMFSRQNGMQYQPVGSLYIHFPGHENISNYYRDLDLTNATASVSYEVNGTHFKREVFASFPNKIIVVRLTADKPAAITCNLSFGTAQNIHTISVSNHKLILSGTCKNMEGIPGKVQFEAQAKALSEGGKLSFSDTSINISKANTAIIFISIATNFINYHDLSGNASQKASAFLNGIEKNNYDSTLREHINAYQYYFNRVSFDLGTTEASKKPTDVRIKNFNSAKDPQLVSLYFQFGRYLLISGSQPGTQAMNLQGKWNNKMNPPWDCKYTVNINTEMNYWPAEITNLSELTDPLISLVKDLSVTGQESAYKMYGARGWMVHHNTDLWRISGQVDKAFYGLYPVGGAWLTQHLWEHYLYNGDKKYLADIYPVLKGAATYFVDALQEEPEHKWLVVCPSMSPENAFMSDSIAGKVSITAGTTMDNQIVFELFSNTINASKLLGIDRSFNDTLRTMRDRLPPMQIGRFGQLQEWMTDIDRPRDTHKHISHLFGLYPGKQISPFRNPELFEAAKKVLITRGDVSTGWSMGWKVNFWARMLDGNHAYKLVSDQLRPASTNQSEERGGTYPNLFDSHPPFQIDGNFGCTSGIAEMLMQSHDGNIFVLPALPNSWPNGKITGLVARGGFVIDIAWKEGQISTLTIFSRLGGNCRLRTFQPLMDKNKDKLTKAEGLNPNAFFTVDKINTPLISPNAPIQKPILKNTFMYDFSTEPGKTYTFCVSDK